ncbi:RNA polymerase sigma factor ShbA [Aldersonia sp. NBC_00410]|uniref:RNA polymerase sigma factor ShbA n=1 Tax=Aldersonia sp. NBC_00410 TaxID=2975954 RepID=UPI00224E0F49|nr:RNA polymerase sigma factor ShbA [Aldersonia sp. NBC_00410]MCX5042558.1 RNA polymerase sigma factor ShbA [Aldersonia sp. NBC_00410]
MADPEMVKALDDLVVRAVAGDEEAVTQIVRLVHPLMVRHCASRLRNRDDLHVTADDVAQEICMAAVAAIPRYQDRGRSFLAFVYGIAANKIADARRRSRIHPLCIVDDVPERESVEPGPEELALHSERSLATGELMKVLAPNHREVLMMRIVLGWSAAETAEAIGTSAGVVRVMQHRALNRLRAELGRKPVVRELVCA